MKPLSFAVIGTGWRSMYYVRIARQYPELFELKYVLSRSAEKAARLRKEGIPAGNSEEELRAVKPDFLVVSTARSCMYDVCMKWLLQDYPVLCETPAGENEEQLKKLWELKCSGRIRLQIAEQYHRYPLIAAGLKAVEEGKLGEPNMVVLSAAHEYHGASLFRRMLREKPGAVKVCAKEYLPEVTVTDSRQGPVTDGRKACIKRVMAVFEYPSGKTAVYDFSDVQYHSFIRSRHINVQGPQGEWNDTTLRYIDKNNEIHCERMHPFIAPQYEALVTTKLQEMCSRWEPDIIMSNEQDELAIASMLFDMQEYIISGKEVYPMAEALEDAYHFLLINRAAENPGTVVKAEHMPWHCE